MGDKQQSLILASSSKYRQQLLARLGLPFESIAPDIDESPLPDESPETLVKRLAIEKAEIVSQSHHQALVIGSDQLAVFDGQIIGKPGNLDKAIQQLKNFSGKQIGFLTSVALICHSTNFKDVEISEVTVQFKELNNQQIESYLLKDQPYDCAGSFKIESMGISLFLSVDSQDPTSLEGLPLISLSKMLLKAGVDVLE